MTLRAKIASWQGSLSSQVRDLKFQIARLEKAILIGFSLFVLSAFSYVFGVLGTQQELNNLQKEVASLSKELDSRQASGTPMAYSNTSAASTLRFPGPEVREAMLLRVQQLAHQMGLNADSGTYQEVRSGSAVQQSSRSKIVKYQLSMPLQGSYPAMRDWLSVVMNEMPTIALEELSIRRDNVATPVIAAQIRFAFYFEER